MSPDERAVAVVHPDDISAPNSDDARAALTHYTATGDVSRLASELRAALYLEVCRSIGLNSRTRPLDWIEFYDPETKGKKLCLYPNRTCTDQLAYLHRIRVRTVEEKMTGTLYKVVLEGTMPDGRSETNVAYLDLTDNQGQPLRGQKYGNALMKCHCVPLDTEILTRDGFRRYDDVREGDEVLAYDLDADACVWTPLLAVSVFREHTSRMIRLQTVGGQFAVACTEDHSWAIATPPYIPRGRSDGSRGPRGPYLTRGPVRRLVDASAINTGQKIVLAAAEPGPVDGILTPVEAAVLGWAVTDGTIKRVGNSVRVGICQSKEQNFEMIRGLVGAVSPGTKELVSAARTRTFPNGRTYETLPQHWWYISSAVTRAIFDRAGFHDRSDLPKIVTRLSSQARKAMLQAFMLAEGTDRGIFYNGDPHILEAFQILCALEGKATGRLIRHTETVWRQIVKKTRHVAGNALLRVELPSEPVWCPTTAYGTWVMRQDGLVTITGNTKAKRRLILGMVGMNVPDPEHLPRHRMVTVDGGGNILEHPTAEQRALAERPDMARAIGEQTFEDHADLATGFEDEPELPVRPDPGTPPRTGPRPTFRASEDEIKRHLGAWFAAVRGTSLDTDPERARYVTQWTAGIWPEAKQTDSLRTFFARATAAEAGELLAHTRAIVEGERQAVAEVNASGVRSFDDDDPTANGAEPF